MTPHPGHTSRVIAEGPRPGEGPQGGGPMAAFMARAGASLPKQPDLVLEDFDGPGTYLVVDVKTLDVAGATRIAAQHTDRIRLAAHSAARLASIGDYGPMPRGMRLVTFAVSTFGAFGDEAQRLLRDISRRLSHAVPPSLRDEATWATPALGPFMRMALSMAVRRGLARSVADSWSLV